MGKLVNWILVPLALVGAVLLSPRNVSADSLTGSVTLTWYYPDSSTLYRGPALIAVGSTLSCPSGAGLCSAYGEGGNHDFTVGTDSITYTAANDPLSAYNSVSLNGFNFSGLTFMSGASLVGFSLSTNIAGLTGADVTFGPSFIEVNMQGLPINGTYTLTLIPSSVTAPEPGTMTLLGSGLIGLALAFRRKSALARPN